MKSIKEQLLVLKKYWAIGLLAVILIFIAGSINFGSGLMNNFLGIRQGVVYDEGMATSKLAPPGLGYGGGFAPEIEDRIVTQNASLQTEVKRGRFDEADQELRDVVNSSDSFLLNESVSKRDVGVNQYRTGYYGIRVETSKYDSVVNRLKEIGEVQNFSENVDDITSGYTNLAIELEAERERLDRYNTLYSQASSVEDKLSLSDRIYDQERRIKYLEDRVEDLDEDVDYSNLSVTITEKHSDYAGIKFVSFGQLIHNVVRGINNLLGLIFWILPYFLLGWGLWYGIKYLRSRKK